MPDPYRGARAHAACSRDGSTLSIANREQGGAGSAAEELGAFLLRERSRVERRFRRELRARGLDPRDVQLLDELTGLLEERGDQAVKIFGALVETLSAHRFAAG